MTHKRGRFTSRTKARRRAADVLFEADQKGFADNSSALLDLLSQRQSVSAAPSDLPPYAVQIVEGVARNLRPIDRHLAKRAKGAGLDRVPAVDRAIMRVAVWEMMDNSDDVPPVVAIDEAIALVKALSTAESPAYVNAVLDAVRTDLEGAAPAQDADATPDLEVEMPEEYLDEY